MKRGYETYQEVGFYLIGLFKKGVCYVHDLIEFEYSEQSGGFIESGMARYVRLKAGLPLGLQIIGHMHKHPGFTEYSATDKRNFLRYGHSNPLNAFLIYIVDPSEKIRGYTATAEKIFPIKITIRDLTPDETLLEKEIEVEFKTKVLLPKNSTYSDFHFLFSEKISSESLKFLSRPSIQADDKPTQRDSHISAAAKIKVTPRRAIEVEDIGNNSNLRYRILMDENETVADLGKNIKQLISLPQEKGIEVIFLEAGRKLPRSTKIKDIQQPLVWNVEQSVLLPIFKNFHKFWGEIIKIMEREKFKEAQKALNTPEVEATDAQTAIGSSEEMMDIKNSKESTENDSKKKKREYKSYKLDYYT